MVSLSKGHYTARFADGPHDIRRAQALRWLCFYGNRGLDSDADPAAEPDAETGQKLDQDRFDAICTHVLVEDQRDGELVCCFRFLSLSGGHDIGRTYSAQYYNLKRLEGFKGPMVEMGRFCIHPDRQDPNILRLAWAALTRLVDETQVRLLIGCSSFMGAEPATHAAALAMLRDRHLAPKRWLPRVKAPKVFRFARMLRRDLSDPRRGMREMPPLLRSYLLMGGWVSDHAVVDDRLNTMHVFTAVEIGAIPQGRVRVLRAVAG
ncbi:GNAT family N-acetyltransferase [Paracoccus pacificus]|uniref:L-ornithine N(alpha)-acyltransferase n=1 Tax=Paracoccus pacificus TaxID=1463598 RepID=A0ABW4R2K0_9RHOB